MTPIPETVSMRVGASTATAVVQARVRRLGRPPKLLLLPVGAAPRHWILLSTLLHTATVASVMWVPILFPVRPMIVDPAATDLVQKYDYHPLFLPALPKLAAAESPAKIEHRSAPSAPSVALALPRAEPEIFNPPKPDYAATQEIVSNLPDSTNSVQTIRRPDLVAPTKLAHPIRLPSMVILPAPIAPSRVTPYLEQPVLPNPEAPPILQVSQPRLRFPVLPASAPKPKPSSEVPAEPVAPEIAGASDHAVPVFGITTDPVVSAPKAAIVLDAVSVPPGPVPDVPDAELSGNFVVGSSPDASAGETASGAAGGNVAGAGASSASGNSPHTSAANGTGTRSAARGGSAGVATAGSPPSVGTGSGSGGGTGAATGNKGLPGISISGGVSGRSGRAVPTSPNSYGSYSLTVISGGSSGGASRDLGVFTRSEIVYTVYIPMTEAGGGPDWPMQYALNGSDPADNGSPNGLLTPPVVLKKVQATAPKTGLDANLGPVFVTGIIDENGKLQALRAIRAEDGRAQPAVNALGQWEFRPAQLDGKPVASKILIGVTVMPTEEVGKQD